MKKVTNVSLGGMSFQVEDDAYARLDAYLTDIRARFARYAGADEIVQDIEARAAEQLDAMGKKIVTILDVELLIATLGSPEELGGDDEAPSEERATSKPKMKRLFRNPDDTVIAGVAGGIAVWLGIDSRWVRILIGVAVALTIFSPVNFFGIIVVMGYIILWATLPVATTETEKMEMRGEPVTLGNLESALKERVAVMSEDVKTAHARGTMTKGIAQFAAALARIVKAITMMLVRVAGAIAALVSLGVIIAVIIGIANVLANGIHPAVRIGSPDVPLMELFSNASGIMGALALGFVVAIPAAFVGMVGVSIARMRSWFTTRTAFTMLGLWIVAITIASVIGVRAGGTLQDRLRNDRWREEIETTYDLKDFDKVTVARGYDVNVIQGDTFAVTAQGSRASIEGASLTVEDGMLTVNQGTGDTFAALQDTICLFCDTRSVSFTVTLPSLAEITATEGSFVSLEEISSSTIRIAVERGSSVRGNVRATAAAIDANEGSSVMLTGTIDNLAITAKRGSWINLEDADITAAALEITEGSTVSLGSLETLAVKARSGSSVIYDEADDLDRDLTSGASVRKRNEE